MSNIKDAADAIAKFADAMKRQVEQIDTVLCETGDELAFWAWTPEDDFALTFLPLPMRIRDDDLLHSEWSQAVMDALPAHVIVRAYD